MITLVRLSLVLFVATHVDDLFLLLSLYAERRTAKVAIVPHPDLSGHDGCLVPVRSLVSPPSLFVYAHCQMGHKTLSGGS